MCKQRVCVTGKWGRCDWCLSLHGGDQSRTRRSSRAAKAGRKGIKRILTQKKQNLKGWSTDLCVLEQMFFVFFLNICFGKTGSQSVLWPKQQVL